MQRVFFGCVLALTMVAGYSGVAANDVVTSEQIEAALAAKVLDLPPLATGQWSGNVYVLPFEYGASYDASVGGYCQPGSAAVGRPVVLCRQPGSVRLPRGVYQLHL